MYRDEQHRVYPGHPLYDWCNAACHDATNLRNAVRFRQRNIMTALKKEPKDRHLFEKLVLDELEQTIPLMNDIHRHEIIKKWNPENGEPPKPEDISDKYSMPTPDTPYVNYNVLVGMMTHLNNPDYNTSALCANACQRMIRLSCKDIKGFFNSIKEYNAHPEKFTGKPELPGYLRKGSSSMVVFTNDGVHVNKHLDERKTSVITA